MDGEQNGTQALARIEQLGDMPPRLDVVLHSEIDAHKMERVRFLGHQVKGERCSI